MPRKLLADCYRGWYGWEGQKSSVLRMSNGYLWDCRHKMDLEKFRYQVEMERLEGLQKLEEVHSKKALRSLQAEYSRIRAEQKVLQHHAFRRYDPMHDATPPPSPPTPIPLPRRPKTERIGLKPPTPKDQLVKRNSLPSLDSLETRSPKDLKAPFHAKTSAHHRPGSDSATLSSTKKLVALDSLKNSASYPPSGSSFGALLTRRRGKVTRKRSTATLGSSTRDGSFFLTDSEIITSSVPEEHEEEEHEEDEEEDVEEEDEVFEDHHLHRSQNAGGSHDSHVTSNDSAAAISRRDREVEGVKDRPGNNPREHSFQSIDYILGSQKHPVKAPGALTSTHLAKPSTPKDTVKPSNTTSSDSILADGSPDTAVSSSKTASSSHKEFPTGSVSDVKNSESSVHWRSEGDVRPVKEGSLRHYDTERLSDSGKLDPLSPHTADLTDKGQSSVKVSSDVEHFQSSSKEHLGSFTKEHHPQLSTKEHLQSSTKEHFQSSTKEHLQSSTKEHLQSPTKEHLQSSTKEHLQSSTKEHSESSTKEHHQQPSSSLHTTTSSTTTDILQLNHNETFTPRTEETTPRRTLLSSLFKPHHPSEQTPRKDTEGEEEAAAAAAAPKISLLDRFRQAAEVIVEEKREEKLANSSLFAALLLNRPQKQVKLRALEKPAGVAAQEEKDLWKSLLSDVQHAVRWKAKILRESQGIPNTRQLRKQAKEQQETKERSRRHVFPGHCKTTYAMKQFLSREVEELVEASRPENRRKHRNKLLKDMASMPDFVDRVRSTTAILRDFKQYQDTQGRKEKVPV